MAVFKHRQMSKAAIKGRHQWRVNKSHTHTHLVRDRQDRQASQGRGSFLMFVLCAAVEREKHLVMELLKRLPFLSIGYFLYAAE